MHLNLKKRLLLHTYYQKSQSTKCIWGKKLFEIRFFCCQRWCFYYAMCTTWFMLNNPNSLDSIMLSLFKCIYGQDDLSLLLSWGSWNCPCLFFLYKKTNISYLVRDHLFTQTPTASDLISSKKKNGKFLMIQSIWINPKISFFLHWGN